MVTTDKTATFHPWLGFQLAAVAGYVDTLSFVALFGLFTAHVTGNFVLIGSALIGEGQGLLLKLLVFPAFIVGVVLTRLLAWREGMFSVRLAFALQAALLLAGMVSGLIAQPIIHADTPWAMACGLLAAAAMGMQNAQGRLALAALVPTTVMTGSVTQAVLDAMDVLAGATDARAAARNRLRRLLPAIIAFALGAIAGALLFHLISFWALLLPVAQLLWAAFIARAK